MEADVSVGMRLGVAGPLLCNHGQGTIAVAGSDSLLMWSAERWRGPRNESHRDLGMRNEQFRRRGDSRDGT